MDLLSLPQLVDRILGYKPLPDQKQFRSLPASLQDLIKRDDRFPLFAKAIHQTISTRIDEGNDPLCVLAENRFGFEPSGGTLSDVISKDAFRHSPAYARLTIYHSGITFLIPLSLQPFRPSMHEIARKILSAIEFLLPRAQSPDQQILTSFFDVLLRTLLRKDKSEIRDHSHPLLCYSRLLDAVSQGGAIVLICWSPGASSDAAAIRPSFHVVRELDVGGCSTAF
jgi:hypothetical protein